MGVDHIGGQAGLRQEIQKLWRELRRVAKATLQNGSIGRAGIRVYDGGWIRIEGGGLSVTGTQTVSGRLEGSGVFDWTGPMNLQGAQTITGPTTFTGQMTVNGPWKLVGNGSITGDVSVTGDFKVLPGGKIQVGNMVIDPTGGGKVSFPGGAEVRASSGGGVTVEQGNYAANVTSSGVSVGRSGRSITVREAWPPFQFVGLPTITASDSGLPPASTYMSPSGEPYRVIPDP